MKFFAFGSGSKSTLGAVTPDDFEKLRGLRRMQALAIWLLVFMALVFAISFALQDKIPAFGFVRAASEGGMVGAIADWFAVTALFRHPLGLKIPHTNLIAKKKNDIGAGLGSFIEENFLADEVVFDKLANISGARHAGEWLSNKDNATKVSDVAAEVLTAALTVLDDDDVRELLEAIVRKHIVEPEWGNTLGRVLEQVLEGNHQATTVDLLADHFGNWLIQNPDSFNKMFSSRLPSWVPSFANRFVDKKLHSEVVKFVEAVQHDPLHPLRETITRMLQDFADRLQNDPALRARVQKLKLELFTSKRVRDLAASAWSGTRSALLQMLADRESELRVRLTRAITDMGARLAEDSTLQYKVDVWVMNAVTHLVHTYRHDLANVVTDTVKNWDATEAAEKIELQIGKDLQYIRINGTVVGSIAGLTIYTAAILVRGIFI